MSESELRELLDHVRAGTRSADEALQHLRSGPFRTTNLGFAQVDHHRRLRQGLGEVIFGEGKTAEQVIAIAAEAGKAGAPVLITRLQPEKSAEVAAFPGCAGQRCRPHYYAARPRARRAAPG
jgi:pyridinium-3,5-biscarboxylic acid mononucleotide synthase